jgi:hypothetical protein
MKRLITCLCCAAAAHGLPGAASPAAAQDANLRVVPRIGLYMPMAELGDNAEIAGGLALGAAAELALPGLPLTLRASVDYAPATDVVERSAAERVLGEASLLTAVAAIVLRPLAATATAQPFFVGGAGIKTHNLAAGPGAGGDLAAAAGITTRPTLYVGGGVDVRFGPISLVLEVGNFMSTFPVGDESPVQHDVFGTAGFRIVLF